MTDKGPVGPDSVGRNRRLNERPRAEFIAGAEWRKRTGRPMTTTELGRVLRRYPAHV